MPCNAILQQAAQLGISPALILKHPAILQLLADRIQTMTGSAKLAVCPANDWWPTYYAHLDQLHPIAQVDTSQGVLFFAYDCSFAVLPDGSVQIRDGGNPSRRPANPAELLAAVTNLIQVTCGLLLQQQVLAQVAQVAQITSSTTAANGALVLTINA